MYLCIENITAQAEACRRLGQLYSQNREFGLALDMMERNFDLIKHSTKFDMKLLDQARIHLGVIRAHQKFDGFINLITESDDLSGLLNWKATRAIDLKQS